MSGGQGQPQGCPRRAWSSSQDRPREAGAVVSGTWEEGAGAAGSGAPGLAPALQPVAPASTRASVCSL